MVDPAPAEKITLNMTGRCRRKSKTKRRLTQQLYTPREVLEAEVALPASQKSSSKRTRQAKASGRRSPASCQFVAHSDDLEAFLQKFAYPQFMDVDSPTEIDMIPAFDKLGTASDQQSVSDSATWRRSHRLTTRALHSNAKCVKCKIFIHHEEDPETFTAPQRARNPTATMHELESLYGPQQLISNVFHKRQICTQEQFLVRWAPTFMLKHHIDSYRQALYETDMVQEIKGYLHHNAPALCLVSWKDSWEPGETIRQLQHLDGDVMSIDQRALSSVTRRLWSTPKDLQLPNLDRQSFQGTQCCSAANPFNLEPFLHNYVTIKTGNTLNPDLDIAPPGAYVIKADPRPSSSSESQEHQNTADIRPSLLAVYGPDGKAAGTITKERLLILYRSYEQIISNASDTACDAFPKAIASMLSRYKDGRQTSEYHMSSDQNGLQTTYQASTNQAASSGLIITVSVDLEDLHSSGGDT